MTSTTSTFPRVMSLDPISFPPLPSQEPSSTSSEPLSTPQSPSLPTSPSHISHSASSSVSTTSEEEDDEAQREWQESLAQLTLLVNLVLLPFIGKYFGRKFAYFIWARLMEWRYPVEVIVTSKTTFEMAGLAEAAILGARNLRR